MRILEPDHVITGKEYVRSIVNFGEEYSYGAYDGCLLKWTPIVNVIGSCWKGTAIEKFELKVYHYMTREYVIFSDGDYCPNRNEIDYNRARLLGWDV